MSITVTAQASKTSPYIELVVKLPGWSKGTPYYLNLRQTRELTIALEKAVDEHIKGR